MTLVLSFRSRDIAGNVVAPTLYDVDPLATPLTYRMVPRYEWDSLVGGRDVMFATHGFNVHGPDGVRSLAGFGSRLDLRPSDLYIAVIWPGDWWIPAINYPFEGNDAKDCGRRLATWCGERLSQAASISFVSHSLGARLILETLKNLDMRARLVCLMAGAINRDCLETEYRTSRDRSDTIRVLASRADRVLQLAFPAGDLVSELIDPDHIPLTAALGRSGPVRSVPGKLDGPWQISPGERFGHGDYLPEDATTPATGAKWSEAGDFVRRAWRKQPQSWPT